MATPRLGIKLDAKSHGDIKRQWKRHFAGKFGSDRTACFTELYYVGREYVDANTEGHQVFSETYSRLRRRKAKNLMRLPVRIRLDDAEIARLAIVCGAATGRAAADCAASFITIGYSHANGNLINRNRAGRIL